jgi:predicted amidophosphoribosyltransferase
MLRVILSEVPMMNCPKCNAPKRDAEAIICLECGSPYSKTMVVAPGQTPKFETREEYNNWKEQRFKDSHLKSQQNVAASEQNNVIVSPAKKTMQPSTNASANGTKKKCPFCAEEILVEAKKCKHCGEYLSSPSASFKV